MSRWNLHLFGGLSLESDGMTIDQFPTKRSATILARLATSRNGSVSRDELAEELWPEDYLDSTRMRLRQELSRLRTALRDAKDVVDADRTWVRLDLDAVSVDCREFDRCVHLADHADSDGRRTELLSRACDLYRGPLLPELSEAWVYAARSDAKEKLERCYSTLIDIHDGTEALTWAGRAARSMPGQEPFVVRFAELQLKSGQALGALSTIEEAERLGLFSPTLAKLKREAQQSQETELPFGDFPSLGLPVAVVQLREPGLPSYFDTFIGRQDEIALLAEMLGANTPVRCVTLVGPGGVGKTRLSTEVSRQLTAVGAKPHFLSMEEVSGDSLDDRIAEAFGRGDANLLLLDNAETDIDAAAKAVRRLLSEHADAKVLATSRQRLAISGERAIELAPIGMPFATDEFEEMLLSPSVQLFLQRAQEHDSSFRIREEESVDLASLLNRLEGLPLAIELAAAKVSTVGLRELASRFDDLYTMLVTRRRDIPARQRSIYATIDWSYQNLDEPLREAIQAISVCPAGCSAEVATALIGQEAPMMLDDLRDRSLIVASRHDGRLRYRMLDPIRAYVLDQLSESESLHRVETFAACLTDHLAQSWRDLMGPREPEFLREIGREFDNVLAILNWCREHNKALALRLAAVAWRYWCLVAHRKEGFEAHLRLVSDEDLPKTMHLPSVLFGAAYTAVTLGRTREADDLFRRTHQAYLDTGQGEKAVWVTLNMGCVADAEGDYPKMLDYVLEALPQLEELGDPLGPALAHADLACAHAWMGEFDAAEKHLQASFQYRTKLNSPVEMARYLFDKARVLYEREAYDEAIRLGAEARMAFEGMGQHGLEFDVIRFLSEAYVDSGQYDLALAEIALAEERSKKLGLIHDPGWLDRSRALAFISLGSLEDAQQSARAALRTALHSDMVQAFVEGILVTCVLLQAMGKKEQALTLSSELEATLRGGKYMLRPSGMRWLERLERTPMAAPAASWQSLAAHALEKLL